MSFAGVARDRSPRDRTHRSPRDRSRDRSESWDSRSPSPDEDRTARGSPRPPPKEGGGVSWPYLGSPKKDPESRPKHIRPAKTITGVPAEELRAKREKAGKERAHQIQLEHAAEEGDRDAIEALKKLSRRMAST